MKDYLILPSCNTSKFDTNMCVCVCACVFVCVYVCVYTVSFLENIMHVKMDIFFTSLHKNCLKN